MRVMYDSVQPGLIPATVAIVVGYVSGPWAWSDADWARFPHALKVRIATEANCDDGLVLDVERTDATPAQVPAWLEMRRKAGIDPAVYCGAGVIGQVYSACDEAKVARPHIWVANWNKRPDVPDGAVAHQYASTAAFDLSMVLDFWPGLDQPRVIPAPAEEEANEAGATVAALASLYKLRSERLTAAGVTDDGTLSDLHAVATLLRVGYQIPTPGDQTK